MLLIIYSRFRKTLPVTMERHGSPGPSLRSRKHILALDDESEATIVGDEHYSKRFLQGLTLAGLAASLLGTIFSLFNVDVFLRVYELPLHSFATGSVIFGIVNTANDLIGAWWVDTRATQQSRSAVIGTAGCFFCVGFLAPFFRWSRGLVHFVGSMSVYDTMYSLSAILMGSVVTDNHHMTDTERQNFMASGKAVNLVANFVVARLALYIFEMNDMEHFQLFLLLLSIFCCFLFVIAQGIMDSSRPHSLLRSGGGDYSKPERPLRTLRFKRVCRDFWNHSNFKAWIGMEVLLESQNSFQNAFLKTFVDQLIHSSDISKGTCDWVLSLIRPLTLIGGILCYIPIRRVGYPRVYMALFISNMILSLTCLLLSSPEKPFVTLAFLIVFNVSNGAVQAAGFHLAMSDMVLEMKYKHAIDSRLDEPSLAGLFMGTNALLCKPMESFLPVVAALVLDDAHFQAEKRSASSQEVLFYLLMLPPLLFSGLQILSWSHYSLVPGKTEKLRHELQRLASHDSSNESLRDV